MGITVSKFQYIKNTQITQFMTCGVSTSCHISFKDPTLISTKLSGQYFSISASKRTRGLQLCLERKEKHKKPYLRRR
jgi:hypothetical protein